MRKTLPTVLVSQVDRCLRPGLVPPARTIPIDISHLYWWIQARFPLNDTTSSALPCLHGDKLDWRDIRAMASSFTSFSQPSRKEIRHKSGFHQQKVLILLPSAPSYVGHLPEAHYSTCMNYFQCQIEELSIYHESVRRTGEIIFIKRLGLGWTHWSNK